MGETKKDTIAVIFDFDDTLTPDSTSQFIHSNLGLVPERFWTEQVDPLREEGWDLPSSCLYTLIQHSQRAEMPRKITKEKLAEFGRQLSFYPGVPDLFDNLKGMLHKINPTIRLEFYLIGCGLKEIIRHTPIAPHFNDIWACEFAYTPQGEIFFPKNIVSFTDKTRHLFQISKGITSHEGSLDPFRVNRRMPRSQRAVPFDQMIYVADGFTDIPCFALVKERGGIAIGVYDPNNPAKIISTKELSDDQRVSTLQSTDYRPSSDLYRFLTLAIEAMATRIMLKKNSYQGF